jgi:hypothetical protein
VVDCGRDGTNAWAATAAAAAEPPSGPAVVCGPVAAFGATSSQIRAVSPARPERRVGVQVGQTAHVGRVVEVEDGGRHLGGERHAECGFVARENGVANGGCDQGVFCCTSRAAAGRRRW